MKILNVGTKLKNSPYRNRAVMRAFPVICLISGSESRLPCSASVFKYNAIPVKLDKSAYAWFYGKPLLAALCERLVNEGRFPFDPVMKKNEQPLSRERLSLWRELYIAQTLLTISLIDSLGRWNLLEHIKRLPALCAGSKRKRVPRLCIFSSA
jgi:hypothetical protein